MLERRIYVYKEVSRSHADSHLRDGLRVTMTKPRSENAENSLANPTSPNADRFSITDEYSTGTQALPARFTYASLVGGELHYGV